MMDSGARYLFVVQMDVDPAQEALFNEVYDTEHIPNLMTVPGVRKAWRLKGVPYALAISGEVKESPAPSPAYTALYEIDAPEVLTSPEWAAAVEKGRWPGAVRPHTTNRKHALLKLM
jgi:hypothetical protein